MSNLTKSESARINGAKSHGPKTPEGKAISSMNSLTHGLSAKTLLLQNENSDQFTEMMNSYFDYLAPKTQIETDLAADLVAARWRLRRIWRYETAILDIEMDAQASDFEKRFEKYDEDIRGAQAFSTLADKSKGLRTALQFDIHLGRTYRRALEQFRRQRNAIQETNPRNRQEPI